MMFEDNCGKILTEEDINSMFPWEIDEYKLHVHENSYECESIRECKLLDMIKKINY